MRLEDAFLSGYLRIEGLVDVRRRSWAGLPPPPRAIRPWLTGRGWVPGTALFQTQDYPTLTTYFEAEVIGPKHNFLTRKWDTNERVDRQHWVSAVARVRAASIARRSRLP